MKLQLIKENQICPQMTIYRQYGQNQGYFKRDKNDSIGTRARIKLYKIKIVFLLLRVCRAMAGFSSRNTSLWRYNKVFRDEKRVVVLHTLSRKNPAISILCNVVLAPVPIHSLSSRLKYPQFWPYLVIWREIWISLIICNVFLSDWDGVLMRNHRILCRKLSKFVFLVPNLDIIYGVTIAVIRDEIETN